MKKISNTDCAYLKAAQRYIFSDKMKTEQQQNRINTFLLRIYSCSAAAFTAAATRSATSLSKEAGII